MRGALAGGAKPCALADRRCGCRAAAGAAASGVGALVGLGAETDAGAAGSCARARATAAHAAGSRLPGASCHCMGRSLTLLRGPAVGR